MMRAMRAETGAGPVGAGPGLRRDARHNRHLLLDAARQVLQEQGLDASLDVIARRAGVGNATLYRHFPTREKLYEAVFAEAGDILARVRERVLRIDDPWTALAAYLEEACAFLATDQGLSDLMMQGMPRSPVLNEFRVRSDQLVRTLLDQAQRQGAVRSDIGLTDVLLILGALQRVVPATAAVCPHSWRRHLAITLDGLRPHNETTLPAAALSYDQLLEVGQHFHPPRRAGNRKQATSPI
jgi:AcrR family transcriptional regulator